MQSKQSIPTTVSKTINSKYFDARCEVVKQVQSIPTTVFRTFADIKEQCCVFELILKTDENGEPIPFTKDIFTQFNWATIFSRCDRGDKCHRDHSKLREILNTFANDPSIWFDYVVYAIRDMKQKYNRIYRMFESTGVKKGDRRPCYATIDGAICKNPSCNNIHSNAEIDAWYLEHPDEWVCDFLYDLNKPFKEYNKYLQDCTKRRIVRDKNIIERLKSTADLKAESARRKAIDMFKHFKDAGKEPIVIQSHKAIYNKGDNKDIAKFRSLLGRGGYDSKDVFEELGKILDQARNEDLPAFAEECARRLRLMVHGKDNHNETIARETISYLCATHPQFAIVLHDVILNDIKVLEGAILSAMSSLETITLNSDDIAAKLDAVRNLLPYGFFTDRVDAPKDLYVPIARYIGLLETLSPNGLQEAYKHILELLDTNEKSLSAVFIAVYYFKHLDKAVLRTLKEPDAIKLLNNLVSRIEEVMDDPTLVLKPNFSFRRH